MTIPDAVPDATLDSAPDAASGPVTPTESADRSVPVTQRAIERIKERIADGTLKPGDRLPTERELASDLGVSRSSMREAIRALTTLGVLEARHGAGVYVTSLRPADLLETFSVLAEVSQGETLIEVLQVRRMLEPAATALAAARADDAQLRRLGEILNRMEAGGGSDEADADADAYADTVSADLTFHQAIVEITGNATLAAINDGLSSRTFNARVWRGHREAGITARLREDHERIYRALQARDPDAARAAATMHVLEVERWLRADLTDDVG
ncbi:FadR family transcriptional regulator [Nocardiopsis gilva YIM 90087]|uniref:FadR family transcriptional regulator n=1 Tax=Nocardiopsis gilva YIM 90087 TaxID=1235441 RepID=A0A223S6J8_9ACTN|nr:FadR family transcriptional regulator [Nocardiopsis gilva YIM 90087]